MFLIEGNIHNREPLEAMLKITESSEGKRWGTTRASESEWKEGGEKGHYFPMTLPIHSWDPVLTPGGRPVSTDTLGETVNIRGFTPSTH